MSRTTRPLHPFVHRPKREISRWLNPFNELASTPSSLIQIDFLPVTPGRLLIHQSSVRLRPAIRLFGPFLYKSSLSALCVATFIVYHPMTPFSAYNTSNCCRWTQHSLRIDSPSWIFVAAMGCRNVLHMDVPITNWALVSSD